MDTTLTLTNDMLLVLSLVVFTMLMFLFERIRADVVSLVVLVLLGLTGLVAPEDLFGGFSSDAVMNVIATMILGAGLDRTGALNRLAGWLLRHAQGVEQRLIFLSSAVAGLNSAMIQNTSATSLYLPVASRLTARTGISLSRLLMPMSAAIIMGGSLTMVGNSPLILLNDLLVSANANMPSGAASLQPLKMFAPLPIGLVLLAAGLLYFHFFGHRVLREDGDDAVSPGQAQNYFARAYGIEGDIYELTVLSDSPLAGLTIGEVEALSDVPLLLALQTGSDARLSPSADMHIRAGSALGVMGSRQQVADFAHAHALRIAPRLRKFADLFNPSNTGISEAVVPPTSTFLGKPQTQLHLRKQYGLSLLAINRDKQILRDDVRNIPIRAGDMLVLHSHWSDLAEAAKCNDFVVVTDFPKDEQRPHKFKIAMTIFAVSMLLALSSRIPTSIALMTGVAGMLVTGVLKMDEAYAAISWKTVFLMACLIPMGWAMDSSGAAAWVAGHSIDRLPDGMPVWLIELALALFTTAFSMVISHVGATIVMVPLAINLALAVDGNPTAFALIVALSASNNFITASNPSVSMITGPAGYSMKDMWRSGGPLTLVYTFIIVVMINLLY